MRRRSPYLFPIAGAILLALPSVATAEVQRIELDVAGYLCGR